MEPSWITALDNCAAGGVLDYDAAADILGQPERFVGHPKFEDVPAIRQPLLLPPNTKIKGQLNADEFSAQNSLVQNPSWKKWVFGGLLTGGAIALAVCFKKGKMSIPKWSTIKSKLHMPKLSSMGTAIVNFGKKVWKYIKKPFSYIASKFK